MHARSYSLLPICHIDKSAHLNAILQRSLDGQVEATQPYKTAAAQQLPGEQRPTKTARPPVPKLAIVLMCAGTRGDVQPFIALGLQLKVTALLHWYVHTYSDILLVLSAQVFQQHEFRFGDELDCMGLSASPISNWGTHLRLL